MLSILEKKTHFDSIYNDLSSLQNPKSHLSIKLKEENGVLIPATTSVTWLGRLIKKICQFFHISDRSTKKIAECTLDFFEKNKKFLNQSHKEFLQSVGKSLYIANTQYKKRFNKLLKKILNKKSSKNDTLLICENEKTIFTSSELLKKITFFKAALDSPLKKDSLQVSHQKAFPELKRAFTLDQFSKRSLKICLKFLEDQTTLQDIEDFNHLYEIYLLSDYLMFDELKKACLSLVVQKHDFQSILTCTDEDFDQLKIDLLDTIRGPDLELFLQVRHLILKTFELSPRVSRTLKRIEKDVCLKFLEDQTILQEIKDLYLLSELYFSSYNLMFDELKKACVSLILYQHDFLSILTCTYERFDQLKIDLLDTISDLDSELFLQVRHLILKTPNAISLQVSRSLKRIEKKDHYYIKVISSRSSRQITLRSPLLCYRFFKVFPGERIDSAKGKGTVLGTSSGYLWVQLDGDSGASYWDDVISHKDFNKHSIKPLRSFIEAGDAIETESGPVEMDAPLKCFVNFRVLPGMRVLTNKGKGIIKGTCHNERLWIQLDNDSEAISYLSSPIGTSTKTSEEYILKILGKLKS